MTDSRPVIAPWRAFFPFGAGETLRFQIAWMLVTLRGQARVEANEAGALALACHVPAQRVLGKPVPETAFAMRFEHRAEGAGNRAVLTLRGDLFEDPEAVIETTPAGRRVSMARPGGGRYGFTLVRRDARNAEMRALSGPNLPAGAKVLVSAA